MAKRDEDLVKRAVAVESGKRLSRARDAAGHSQEDLARLTGWSEEHPRHGLAPSRIANYEQGTRQIRHYEAAMFAKVYKQYHMAYFLGAIGEREAIVLRLVEQNVDPPTPPTPAKSRKVG